jgi:hypothetical protein
MRNTRHRFLLMLCVLLSLLALVACEKDDDDDASDDAIAADDTGPGTSGWLISLDKVLYGFKNGHADANQVFDFDMGVAVITAYEEITAFCVESESNYISVWRYEGTFQEDVLYDDSESESGVSPRALAYYGPGEDDYILLVRIVTDEPSEYLDWLGTDPSVDPVGLFSGFRGGAYPFDASTVYQFGNGAATSLATVPEGEITSAVPWGEDGMIVMTDEAVWSWNEGKGWSRLADGTGYSAVTDLEGDFMLADRGDDDLYSYYLFEDGHLNSYTAFDTSDCFPYTAGLLKGSGRIFWCRSKPADMTCDETDGSDSYLVTETNGSIACNGADIPCYEGISKLRVQW